MEGHLDVGPGEPAPRSPAAMSGCAQPAELSAGRIGSQYLSRMPLYLLSSIVDDLGCLTEGSGAVVTPQALQLSHISEGCARSGHSTPAGHGHGAEHGETDATSGRHVEQPAATDHHTGEGQPAATTPATDTTAVSERPSVPPKATPATTDESHADHPHSTDEHPTEP